MKDDIFADFHSSLDGEMKRLQTKGIWSTSRQADPLTVDEEETLWERRILAITIPICYFLLCFS